MGLADALEFSAGDDVKACSLLREEAHDGERRVSFDGVADRMWTAREGRFEELEAVRDLPGRIDIERRAVLVGEDGEAGFVAVKSAVAVGEWAGADLVWGCLFSQNLNALKLGGILFARNDEPSGEVREESDAGEEDEQDSDEANAAGLPSIAERDGGTYTADDPAG